MSANHCYHKLISIQQVLIQESGRSVGVGAVWQFYGNHAMPGCKDGTVGYIVNQGKVFGPCLPVNPERGLEYESE